MKKIKTFRVWFKDGGAILVNAETMAGAEKLALEKSKRTKITKIEDLYEGLRLKSARGGLNTGASITCRRGLLAT